MEQDAVEGDSLYAYVYRQVAQSLSYLIQAWVKVFRMLHIFKICGLTFHRNGATHANVFVLNKSVVFVCLCVQFLLCNVKIRIT